MKHSTFLSSRSTAGTVSSLLIFVCFDILIRKYSYGIAITSFQPCERDALTISNVHVIIFQAEWMAPEVLRNEPSDEK